MKIVGIVKSIVGTDAVIAIDEDGNQRAIFPGDILYDNEKLLELSGVQVNVEPVTVADAQKKSEPKSDKEVASLQDALLNGKDISELEETAAGGNAGGGNASSDGVSLGAASFVASGHESSIHADANAISEVAPASVAGVTNVSGGAEEFAGKTEPYSDVRIIMVDKSNNNSVDMQVRADENGEFSQKVSEMFPKGTYDVSVQVIDPAGNWVAPIKLPVTEAPSAQPSEPTSSDSLVVSPTLALTDITLDNMYPGYPEMHLGKDPLLDLDNRMTDFTPTFSGTSDPFANIKVEAYGIVNEGIYSNLDKLVTLYTKADEHGNWKVESDKELGLYQHEVKVSTVDDHGTVLSSLSPVEFMMPTRILHVDPYEHL